MTHPVLGDWMNALGGAAVVGLGLFVLSVRPRTVANVSFATFAVSFGVYFLSGNVADALHLTRPLILMIPLFLAWTSGVVLMALTFPRTVSAADRGPLLAAAAVTLTLAMSGYRGFMWILAIDPLVGVMLASSMLAEAVLGGYVILLVLRYRRSPDPVFRRQAVLTAAALTMYVGFIAGFGRTGADGLLAASGPILAHAVVRVVLLVGIAALWLASTNGPDPRMARNMAWLSLAMPLLGLFAHALGRVEGGHGVARLLMTSILAYAILHHRLLGLDAKVRWGVSRSTVAAVFIAVFFLASEGAQLLFGQENEVVGLFAAGALVFAIAPLHRAAERLAEKAVPTVTGQRADGTGPTASSVVGADVDAREGAYQNAVRLALRDSVLTREDEVQLHELAEQLGIGAGRAHALLLGVERERVSSVPTGTQEGRA